MQIHGKQYCKSGFTAINNSLIYIAVMIMISLMAACDETRKPFQEEEVDFINQTDGTRLAGTITTPSFGNHFPGVLLISGSGQQDRDETIYGYKPFKQIAEHLALKGIASLRFDDRGKGESTGDVWNATIDVLASDALAGFHFLKSQPNINPEKVGIIGHSLGGMQGMMLAADYKNVAFLILLGSPGIPWSENYIASDAENLRRQGKPDAVVAAGSDLLIAMVETMKSGGEYSKVKTKLENDVKNWKSGLSGKAAKEIAEFESENPGFFNNFAGDLTTPIYLSVANFDPADYLLDVECPVLSIIGEKDVQALPEENNKAIKFHLKTGGNPYISTFIAPYTNHLFQYCNTGTTSEYVDLKKNFNPDVLKLITTWILHLDTPKPKKAELELYLQQTEYSDPGTYAYLYDDLPADLPSICNLIKKQLIHPQEAQNIKNRLPTGRGPEDGNHPTVEDMLATLYDRDSSGLTLNRTIENRLIVACYHHALLLASILRHQGIPVRLRGGFARYYEQQAKVRFGHVVCEMWDVVTKCWVLFDPDRNIIDVDREKFEFPAVAWLNFHQNSNRSIRYISSVGEGYPALAHALLLDQSFLIGNESSYWHTPEFLFKGEFLPNDCEQEKIEIVNSVAEVMNTEPIELNVLQHLYDNNPVIHKKIRSLETYYHIK